MIMLMGRGLSMLYARSKKISIVSFAALAVIMFISIYPIISFRHEYSTAKAFADFVSANTEKNSYIILYGDDRPTMEYYTKRAYIDYPTSWYYDDIYNFISKVDAVLDKNTSVYVSETVFIEDQENRAIEIFNLMSEEFDFTPTGTIVWENMHKSEVISQKFNVTLFRLTRKTG
jgi:hypothetical protein